MELGPGTPGRPTTWRVRLRVLAVWASGGHGLSGKSRSCRRSIGTGIPVGMERMSASRSSSRTSAKRGPSLGPVC